MSDGVFEIEDDAGKIRFFNVGNLNTETLQTIKDKVEALIRLRLPLYLGETRQEALSGPTLNIEASAFPTGALRRICNAVQGEIDSRKSRFLNADLTHLRDDDIKWMRDRLSVALEGRKPRRK